MGLYRDEGVVLRTQKLGEADRIVTLLTRQHGLVRAVAKGVRRTTSRFGARLEPFSHVDCQFAEGRSLDIITQVEAMGVHGRAISADYSAYTSGTVMLETAERLTGEEGHPSVQQYLLLVGALRALEAGDREPGSILDSFLLRSLAVSGYAPSFEDCARCGAPGPHRAFTPAAGGMLCDACRMPGSARPAPETVLLMGALLSGDWEVVGAAAPRHAREASTLVAAYLAWHLERSLRSLSHVER
uniref:DNA repair protein RecO n=1 Tax=uncultured Nocardioidaceae bacterium TaxID=253824 RepID=A0A6J4LR61_9ACTN|nr:MAG: DNA recombination and repair protein RecO [uncultured Nocardioidaceae bacterium]